MEDIPYYSVNDPVIDEIVLIQIIDRTDLFFNVKLLEYAYNGIINFQNATKKKKIKNWNSIVNVNKNLIAKVIDIDTNYKIVQLTIIYLDDQNNKNMTFFNENKIMESFMKSYCIINNYNLKEIWISIIHELDKKRRNDDDTKSLWLYFIDNIYNLNNEKLILLYEKKYKNENKKILSKIGIISTKGINNTQLLLNELFKNINSEHYILKYDAAPYYLLESYTENTNIEDHKLIINKLNELIFLLKLNNIIFIKEIFIGNIV